MPIKAPPSPTGDKAIRMLATGFPVADNTRPWIPPVPVDTGLWMKINNVRSGMFMRSDPAAQPYHTRFHDDTLQQHQTAADQRSRIK
jgi:hypothetical protein